MRTVLFAFLLGLFCRNVLASPDMDPVEIVRNAMIERLLDGNSARLKLETPVDMAFVKKIAPKRLGSNIVASATGIAGVNFRFESLHQDLQDLPHVEIWVFSYRNNKTALRNAKTIRGLCRGECFRSKLLTFFSYTVVSNKIVIIFTENSGDESIVDFVKSVPKIFDK